MARLPRLPLARLLAKVCPLAFSRTCGSLARVFDAPLVTHTLSRRPAAGPKP